MVDNVWMGWSCQLKEAIMGYILVLPGESEQGQRTTYVMEDTWCSWYLL